jgi:hypothetical protein
MELTTTDELWVTWLGTALRDIGLVLRHRMQSSSDITAVRKTQDEDD